MKVSVSRPNTSSIRGWAEPCSIAHRLPVTIISTSVHVANRNCREKHGTSGLQQPRPRWGRRKRKTDFYQLKEPNPYHWLCFFSLTSVWKRRPVSFYTSFRRILIAIVYSLLIVLRSCHGPAWGKSENTERRTNKITTIHTIIACVGLQEKKPGGFMHVFMQYVSYSKESQEFKDKHRTAICFYVLLSHFFPIRVFWNERTRVCLLTHKSKYMWLRSLNSTEITDFLHFLWRQWRLARVSFSQYFE